MDDFIYKYWYHIPIFLVPFFCITFIYSTFEWITHPEAHGLRFLYLIVVFIIYVLRWMDAR